MVEFSREASCWVFHCEWGCFGFDFEGEAEAMDAYLNHDCERHLT